MSRNARYTLMVFAIFFVIVSSVVYSGGAVKDNQKNVYYLKKDGSKWVIVTKGHGVLKIDGEAFGPDTEEMAFENSGLFLPYVAYPIGSWPEAVAIGDVNNDGRNDVVVTTSYYFDPENDHHIHVFLQNGSGGLDPPIKYPAIDIGDGPQSIDIGDLNNDGRADVVVGAYTALSIESCYIGVFFQNDTGALDPIAIYPTRKSYSVKIGDFNNDGLLDVVGIAWGLQPDGTFNHDVDVFLQNIYGTLDPPITYTVTHGGYDEVDVGDVNNDGLTDIIVMSGQYYAFPNIGVLIQKIDGTFNPPDYYDLGIDENTNGVAVGDVNGDALQDIVVTYGGNRPYSFIGTFLQNTSGTLDPAISYPSYDIPEPVEIGDVNFDGKNDVVVAHGGWNAMGVYLQGANGTLLPYELYSIPYASHYNPHGLVIGDISGDGANDVAIADYNNGLVVLYHSPRQEPKPDIKANGSDGPLKIPPGTNLRVTVALEPGDYDGEDADWWVTAKTPFGRYWYTSDRRWVRSDAPIRVHGGPLFDLASYEVLNSAGLPLGIYKFHFGVDLLMNGSLDFDELYLDRVDVTIE